MFNPSFVNVTWAPKIVLESCLQLLFVEDSMEYFWDNFSFTSRQKELVCQPEGCEGFTEPLLVLKTSIFVEKKKLTI